jgi:hypothetical protein
MASTLVRVTDFVPATPILSGEVDSEFNQIVNLLNGTSSAVKGVIKVGDSGDPPLELNQLSTGPLLELQQAGIVKAHFRNDGALNTPAIRDASDNEQLIFTPTASAVNEFTMTNAATGGRPKLSATGGDTDIGIDIIPKGTGVVKIQSGAPVAAADAANKQYVDDQRVRWSVSWLYATLPSGVETTESVQRFIVPDGQTVTIEDIVVVWAAGSDSGASNVFTIKKRNSSGTVGTDVGTIDVNTPAQNALNINNVSDYPLTAGDQIYPLFTTRNTATEQMVTVCIRGYQKVKTT